MRYVVVVRDHFDAAHYIKDYEGKCNREHGHRWTVDLELEGNNLDKKNMLVDFSEVKNILKFLLDDYLDHYQLNNMLQEPNVTAEFLAQWVFSNLKNHFGGVKLVSVTIWESPDASAKFYE